MARLAPLERRFGECTFRTRELAKAEEEDTKFGRSYITYSIPNFRLKWKKHEYVRAVALRSIGRSQRQETDAEFAMPEHLQR